MMHEVDFLGRYLPEFGQLTCLVQHEFFHRYTADEHTLVCIEKLDAATRHRGSETASLSELFEKLDDPFVLYLALLLHDTGKGVGARPHSEASALFAQGVAARLQLSSEQRRSLILLVDHHLTLSNMAQQRNLDDPETVIEFAQHREVAEESRCADAAHARRWPGHERGCLVGLEGIARLAALSRDLAISAGPGGVLSSRRKSSANVSTTPSPRSSAPDFAERSKRISSSCRTIISGPSTSKKSLRTSSSSAASWRTSTCATSPPPLPAIRWEALPEQGHSIVSICTWDRQQLARQNRRLVRGRPGQYSERGHLHPRRQRRARRFSGVRQEIAGGDRPARNRDLSKPSCAARWQGEPSISHRSSQTRRAEARNARPEMDFPTRITIENKSHPTYTLIQIQTPDRLGLLYDLLACLGEEQRLHRALAHQHRERARRSTPSMWPTPATRGKITDAKRIDQLQQRTAPGRRGARAPNDESLQSLRCRNGWCVYLPLPLL